MDLALKLVEGIAPAWKLYAYLAAILALLIASFVRIYIFTRDQRRDTTALMVRVAAVEARVDQLESDRDRFEEIAGATVERLEQIQLDVREMPKTIATLINLAARPATFPP